MEPTALEKVKGRRQRLAPEQLKAELFQKLREEGIFNEFRAFLRNELVKHLYLIEPENVRRKPDADGDSVPKFPLEATNWLIFEHLQRNRYDFTLSVFDLECNGTKSRRAFNFADILSFLGIDPTSESGQTFLKLFQDCREKQFLWKLLSTVADQSQNHDSTVLRMVADKADRSQTEQIEDKLRRIDAVYDSKKRNLDEVKMESMTLGWPRLEPLLKFTNGFDGARSGRAESERFYERALQKHHGEVEELRKSLEEQYRNRFQSLVDREKESAAALERQKSWFEEEMYRQRQDMLLELTKFRQKEEEWESKHRFQEKMLEIESERIASLKRDMQSREECLRKLEVDHERWAAEQKERMAVAERRKFEERWQTLNVRESELNGRCGSLTVKEELFQEKERNFQKMLEDSERLRVELAETKKHVVHLQNENGSLASHAGAAAENVALREEVCRLRAISHLAAEREEAERTRHAAIIQELTERLARSPPKVARLQGELEQLRILHRKELDWWMEQRGRLEGALHRAQNQHRLYIERLKLQSQQVTNLHKTIEDLQNGLLWKHPRITTDQNIEHQTEFLNAKLILERQAKATDSLYDTAIDLHGTYFDTSLNPSHLPPELELGASGSLADSFGLQYKDSTFLESTAIIDSTRARIRSLEEEAERLEQNYRALRMRTGDNISRKGTRSHAKFLPERTIRNCGTVSDDGEDEWTARRDSAPGVDHNFHIPSSTPKASATSDISPVRMHSKLDRSVNDASKWSRIPELNFEAEEFQKQKSPEWTEEIPRPINAKSARRVMSKLTEDVELWTRQQSPIQDRSMVSSQFPEVKQIPDKSTSLSNLEMGSGEKIEGSTSFCENPGTFRSSGDATATITAIRASIPEKATMPVLSPHLGPLEEVEIQRIRKTVVPDLDSAWKVTSQIPPISPDPLNLDDAWKGTETRSDLDLLWKSKTLDAENPRSQECDSHRSDKAIASQTVKSVTSHTSHANGNHHMSNSKSAILQGTGILAEPNRDDDSSDGGRISGGRTSPVASQDDDFEW